jgi:hypothetical protein
MRYFTAPLCCRLAAVATDRPGSDVFGADALNAELVFTAEVITARPDVATAPLFFAKRGAVHQSLAVRAGITRVSGTREKSGQDEQQ